MCELGQKYISMVTHTVELKCHTCTL